MKKTNLRALSRNAGMLVAAAIVAFWTLPPVLAAPSAALDSSWQIGLQLALLRGLQFGKDVVFTLGPFSFLYFPLFVHPTLWAISFFFTLFIHLLMMAALILFARRVAVGWTGLVLIVVALLFALPVDYLDYRILFTVALLAYLVLTSNVSRSASRVFLGLLAVLLATATMIKFTAFMTSTGVVAGMAAVSVKRKEYDRPFLFVAVFALAWLFLWKLAGQDLAHITAYFANSMQISSGYSAAMADDGKAWHFYLAILAIAAIIFFCATSARKGDLHPLLMAILLGGFLLVSYKHGFVRQDMGHVVIFFGNTMLMLAALYPLLSKTITSIRGKTIMLVCFFALAGGIYDRYHSAVLAPHFSYRIASLRYSLSLLSDASQQGRLRQESMSQIRRALPVSAGTLEALAGKTVDVFPWDIALAYAYGLDWSPRPVFHSYCAYTKALDLLNASHFCGTGAPEMVLFSFKGIDLRYPLFDEPATFRTILRHYRPCGTHGEFLLLQKKEPGADPPTEIGPSRHARLGELLAVPPWRGNGRIFARVVLRYNFIGRLIGLFYKPSELHVKFREAGHDSFSPPYRFISDQAKNGIILSSHVRDLADLAGLFSGSDRGSGIKEFVIDADYPWQFSQPFEVEFFCE
jgi:hypothetical protein